MSKSNHFFKLKVKSRHRYTSSWRAGVITAPRHSNFYTFYTFTETSGSTENITASVHLKPSDTHCETARQLHFVSSEVHASDLREDDFTWARSTWLLLFNLHTCQVETGQRADTAIYHNAASCDTETLFNLNFTVKIFSWSETFYMFRQFCLVTLRFVSQVTVLQYMTEMQRIMTSCLYSRARCVQC